jgi:transcriptional regulator with XRE-family HTH domain
MLKSIYRSENAVVCAQLRAVRKAAGLNQAELAAKFKRLQSFVSTVERGLVRLDIIQLREWCLACGTTLPAFVQALEERLGTAKTSKRISPKSSSKKT